MWVLVHASSYEAICVVSVADMMEVRDERWGVIGRLVMEPNCSHRNGPRLFRGIRAGCRYQRGPCGEGLPPTSKKTESRMSQHDIADGTPADIIIL